MTSNTAARLLLDRGALRNVGKYQRFVLDYSGLLWIWHRLPWSQNFDVTLFRLNCYLIRYRLLPHLR